MAQRSTSPASGSRGTPQTAPAESSAAAAAPRQAASSPTSGSPEQPAEQTSADDVGAIFQEALGRGPEFAKAQGERPTPDQWVHHQGDIAGKQAGAAGVHREVASELRDAGQDELAKEFDVFADAGERLNEVYSGEGSFRDLPAINAEMDATQERIEDLAAEEGVDDETIDDLLGM